MKKSMGLFLALLLTAGLCAGALAENYPHPFQAGAPTWAKEIADKGGPKGFATQVKDKYGDALGEALLESLRPQKGPVEGKAQASVPSGTPQTPEPTPPGILPEELLKLLESLGNPHVENIDLWFNSDGKADADKTLGIGFGNRDPLYFSFQGGYYYVNGGMIIISEGDSLSSFMEEIVNLPDTFHKLYP